jgi:hypothetical protein
MESHRFERRISGRGAVAPLPVTLRATERSRGMLGGLRRSTVEVQAHVVDLSVSGAAVIVREIQGLVVRSPVELCHDGHVVSCTVKRIVPRDDGRVVYGVDFGAMDPAMRDFLFALVEGRRPGDLEQHWLQAR